MNHVMNYQQPEMPHNKGSASGLLQKLHVLQLSTMYQLRMAKQTLTPYVVWLGFAYYNYKEKKKSGDGFKDDGVHVNFVI